MTVRIRGIYATALTRYLDDVVQASPAIRDRFDATIPEGPAAATIRTTDDRQGVAVSGTRARVEAITDRVSDLALDTLSWPAALPQEAVYAGTVTETLGSGAVVDVGDGEGFLPYFNSDRRIETGDAVRVQVAQPRAPWVDGRPVLDVDVAVRGSLVSLVRGDSGAESGTGGGPHLGDLVSAEPPAGWRIRWERDDEDVSLDALGSAVEAAGDRARAIDDALEDAEPPADVAPQPHWTDAATTFFWFGRSARFALDEQRRAVSPTMPGHHRIKAGTESASAAVDFAEAVCAESAVSAGESGDGDATPDGDQDGNFPFGVVTRQFGPHEGGTVRLGHGKPDGSLIGLGEGTVTDLSSDGSLTVEREMTPGGTYDALGVERRAGDVAVTKIREGRWWYPTVYRGDDGQRRGTYVNVCTPVEVFPRTVRYVDLHVDVVKHADGTVERVDDDELDAAVDAGDVSEALAEKARAVASAVERAL